VYGKRKKQRGPSRNKSEYTASVEIVSYDGGWPNYEEPVFRWRKSKTLHSTMDMFVQIKVDCDEVTSFLHETVEFFVVWNKVRGSLKSDCLSP
jgi:hypothetical protein